MGLINFKRLKDDLSFHRWRAEDSETGTSVAVKIKHEVARDFGEQACLQKAEEKYAASGSPVLVTISDMKYRGLKRGAS